MNRSLEYRMVPVADLIPYARNSRTHSDAQVAQIAASIVEFGFLVPVLIDDAHNLIAGHGRLLAARKIGIEAVPAVVTTWLTDAQRRAYTIADNQLALKAGWDEDLLRIELTELDSLGFNLELTGFEKGELKDLMFEAIEPQSDPDEVPEIQADPVSSLGDVWILGHHRIMCGSSTSAEDVERLLAGEKPFLMVTDPPYGVEYDPTWRQKAGISGAGTATGVVLNDDQADWREAWALFPGDVAYVWHASTGTVVVHESLVAAGFLPRNLIIWAKASLVIGRGHYHHQHEPCWYAVRKGGTANWLGGRKQSTLWEIANMHRTQGSVDDGKTGHATQKPVECMRRPIENHSHPGDGIYEPFSGSGTTIIAAELTGRRCFAMELNPLYVDMAIRRWEAFTGSSAVREGDGASFADVAGGNIERPYGERGVTVKNGEGGG